MDDDTQQLELPSMNSSNKTSTKKPSGAPGGLRRSAHLTSTTVGGGGSVDFSKVSGGNGGGQMRSSDEVNNLLRGARTPGVTGATKKTAVLAEETQQQHDLPLLTGDDDVPPPASAVNNNTKSSVVDGNKLYVSPVYMTNMNNDEGVELTSYRPPAAGHRQRTAGVVGPTPPSLGGSHPPVGPPGAAQHILDPTLRLSMGSMVEDVLPAGGSEEGVLIVGPSGSSNGAASDTKGNNDNDTFVPQTEKPLTATATASSGGNASSSSPAGIGGAKAGQRQHYEVVQETMGEPPNLSATGPVVSPSNDDETPEGIKFRPASGLPQQGSGGKQKVPPPLFVADTLHSTAPPVSAVVADGVSLPNPAAAAAAHTIEATLVINEATGPSQMAGLLQIHKAAERKEAEKEAKQNGGHRSDENRSFLPPVHPAESGSAQMKKLVGRARSTGSDSTTAGGRTPQRVAAAVSGDGRRKTVDVDDEESLFPDDAIGHGGEKKSSTSNTKQNSGSVNTHQQPPARSTSSKHHVKATVAVDDESEDELLHAPPAGSEQDRKHSASLQRPPVEAPSKSSPVSPAAAVPPLAGLLPKKMPPPPSSVSANRASSDAPPAGGRKPPAPLAQALMRAAKVTSVEKKSVSVPTDEQERGEKSEVAPSAVAAKKPASTTSKKAPPLPRYPKKAENKKESDGNAAAEGGTTTNKKDPTSSSKVTTKEVTIVVEEGAPSPNPRKAAANTKKGSKASGANSASKTPLGTSASSKKGGSAATPRPVFTKGMVVQARWGGSWYEAIVESVESGGALVTVVWVSNPKDSMLLPAKEVRLPKGVKQPPVVIEDDDAAATTKPPVKLVNLKQQQQQQRQESEKDATTSTSNDQKKKKGTAANGAGDGFFTHLAKKPAANIGGATQLVQMMEQEDEDEENLNSATLKEREEQEEGSLAWPSRNVVSRRRTSSADEGNDDEPVVKKGQTATAQKKANSALEAKKAVPVPFKRASTTTAPKAVGNKRRRHDEDETGDVSVSSATSSSRGTSTSSSSSSTETASSSHFDSGNAKKNKNRNEVVVQAPDEELDIVVGGEELWNLSARRSGNVAKAKADNPAAVVEQKKKKENNESVLNDDDETASAPPPAAPLHTFGLPTSALSNPSPSILKGFHIFCLDDLREVLHEAVELRKQQHQPKRKRGDDDDDGEGDGEDAKNKKKLNEDYELLSKKKRSGAGNNVAKERVPRSKSVSPAASKSPGVQTRSRTRATAAAVAEQEAEIFVELATSLSASFSQLEKAVIANGGNYVSSLQHFAAIVNYVSDQEALSLQGSTCDDKVLGTQFLVVSLNQPSEWYLDTFGGNAIEGYDEAIRKNVATKLGSQVLAREATAVAFGFLPAKMDWLTQTLLIRHPAMISSQFSAFSCGKFFGKQFSKSSGGSSGESKAVMPVVRPTASVERPLKGKQFVIIESQQLTNNQRTMGSSKPSPAMDTNLLIPPVSTALTEAVVASGATAIADNDINAKIDFVLVPSGASWRLPTTAKRKKFFADAKVVDEKSFAETLWNLAVEAQNPQSASSLHTANNNGNNNTTVGGGNNSVKQNMPPQSTGIASPPLVATPVGRHMFAGGRHHQQQRSSVAFIRGRTNTNPNTPVAPRSTRLHPGRLPNSIAAAGVESVCGAIELEGGARVEIGDDYYVTVPPPQGGGGPESSKAIAQQQQSDPIVELGRVVGFPQQQPANNGTATNYVHEIRSANGPANVEMQLYDFDAFSLQRGGGGVPLRQTHLVLGNRRIIVPPTALDVSTPLYILEPEMMHHVFVLNAHPQQLAPAPVAAPHTVQFPQPPLLPQIGAFGTSNDGNQYNSAVIPPPPSVQDTVQGALVSNENSRAIADSTVHLNNNNNNTEGNVSHPGSVIKLASLHPITWIGDILSIDEELRRRYYAAAKLSNDLMCRVGNFARVRITAMPGEPVMICQITSMFSERQSTGNTIPGTAGPSLNSTLNPTAASSTNNNNGTPAGMMYAKQVTNLFEVQIFQQVTLPKPVEMLDNNDNSTNDMAVVSPPSAGQLRPCHHELLSTGQELCVAPESVLAVVKVWKTDSGRLFFE